MAKFKVDARSLPDAGAKVKAMRAKYTKGMKLIIHGRDTWTDATLDRIEAASGGKIETTWDDGAGNAVFTVGFNVRPTKPDRKRILQAVQAITPRVRWEGE